jgi:hypothetical protein
MVTIIGGSASDLTAGVGKVEVNVNNGGWQLASGDEAWSYPLAVTEGAYTVQARATDAAGNVGAPSPAITVIADATAPDLALNAFGSTPIVPTRNAAGQWTVNLTGTVSDPARAGRPGSGLAANGVEVLAESSVLGSLPNSRQTAAINGSNWSLAYVLNDVADPTGVYTVTVAAVDNVGNRTANVQRLLRLDGAAPVVSLSQTDVTKLVISDTVTIRGLVTDTNSLAGIDKLEIAFTPIEQIAALPAGVMGDQAEAQLNRTWVAVTLAQRGAGVAASSWSYQIPAGLEGEYQLDFRATDMLGNRRITPNLWRGVIDTTAPRLVMTGTPTGATFEDAATNTTRYAVQFLCAAQDRNLSEPSFTCPGEGLAEPVRSFENNPALQQLFPDLTTRSGLAISYTVWVTSTTPAATLSACDSFGHCATASTPGAANSNQLAVHSEQSVVTTAAFDQQMAVPAPGAPHAVIVAPSAGSFVAANNAVSVTVAAEAGATLKEVTIRLDNNVVQTLSFAQSNAVTRTLRTLNVPIASEGVHTLVAQATDWANATQTALFPVTFTLDQSAPSLTIDASALTVADTWQPESGILRFNGTANDGVGLAAVQVREGATPFVDATFGTGTWRTALHVQDPEGRTLTITVRAIDRAGRITEITQQINTELSAADAPDTTISSGPTNPSNDNTASFTFTGSASAISFDCQIDDGAYQPCASPQSYSDLSKGSHTFRVRAIDERGFADLTPASQIWTINAIQPDATITGKPTDPTTERTASFTFVGDATAQRFECSLDGAVFTACTSPQNYSGLSNGSHVFLVRAIDGTNKAGAADRFIWTVLNAAPVAADQTVVVIPNLAKAVTLSASDSDPLNFKIVTGPAHGVLLGVPPNLTYVPDTNFAGVDGFTFRASDGLAESNLATVTLYVDNTPPTVTCSANPNQLWPPNNKLVAINATVMVSDEHSGPAGFTLVSVINNEGAGAADMPGWSIDMPDTTGELRATRAGGGSGRIYTLTYRGMDRAGYSTLCSTTVTVPHSQGGKSVTAADYDENAPREDTFVAEGTETVNAPTETPAVGVETPVVVTTPEPGATVTDEGSIDGDAPINKVFLPVVTNAPTLNPQ